MFLNNRTKNKKNTICSSYSILIAHYSGRINTLSTNKLPKGSSRLYTDPSPISPKSYTNTNYNIMCFQVNHWMRYYHITD